MTPPPMPPPVEAQQPALQYAPPLEDAPVLGVAPKKNRANGGRIAAGVSLLAVGYVASIVNTTFFWFSEGSSNFQWFTIIGLPFGIVISAIPVIGPAAAIIGDLAFAQSGFAAFPYRILVNVVSLALQVTGFVLLVTMPRAPKVAKPQRLAITGFGAAPVQGGASVGLGGTFDFPY